MSWNEHHPTSFLSKNGSLISINQVISAGIHHNVSVLNEQTTLDWLPANHGMGRNPCYLQLYTVVFLISRICKLAATHSILTGSKLYTPQDFPLPFIIIFLTILTTVRHDSRNTPASCERIRIELNVGCFIQCATRWDTAVTRTHFSQLQRYKCSHRNYDPQHTVNNRPYNQK